MESSDAEAPHIEVGFLPAEAIPKARANCVGRWRMWGGPKGAVDRHGKTLF